ncbi:MAG TPA: Hsp20/alpha crystallin family protein [Polyangiaceae bacterium]|nr:Hsp20/alpha crystallin family protein [Polyangiaceae bacterium]
MSDEAAVQGTNGSLRTRNPFQRSVAPPVDVFENGDEVLLVADVPGVPGEAIDIRVDSDTLTLEAKRQPADASPALAREYDERSFVRTFRIPAGIDAANIRAEAKRGTVVVRLPKAAAAKPRKIAVR